jgi:hypothetical protein
MSLEVSEARTFLLEMLDKNMLYVPYLDIRDQVYEVDAETIALNDSFYEPGNFDE